ncbi:hypothetical protein EYY60_00345 [Flavobacterium zhairuonense]|uniref:hypothetical protein n=1 Tax=Flavobacterium zhairuonense TaxID=2493631 RepID=UPI0010444C74|nr:hypothetical protein [Flavobacterium zhairuonense]KAF2517613.1 hypothetical protein EYY60_00345 [Flavobacterium zhairuonense]
MSQKNKILKRITLFCCIMMLFANCTNDENLERQDGSFNAKLKETQKWFHKYESESDNYFLVDNLKYNWNQARITSSEDGTETTIVPIIESKKDDREFWEQRLYIYKTGKDDYKALVYEIVTNKDVPLKSQSIDGGDFTGFISVWDLKTGFVRAARFENNQVIETGVVEVVNYNKRNSTNKAPIEAPCVYADFGDGGCGGKSGGDSSSNLPGIVLREVVVTAPSNGSPVEYYGPRSPVIGGGDAGGYTSSNGGGANSGGGTGGGNTETSTLITSYDQLIALINSTNSNGYNITITQDQNGVISGIQINVVPWAGVQIFVQQSKIGDKFVVRNITTNMTGVTVGFTWSQTNYNQTTTGNATVITLNGVWAYNLVIEGIGTVYSSPITYRITVDNRTGKITDGKRL